MSTTGIRDLKNRLSHYVRQVEGGRRIAVTAHGRVVAELVPPARKGTSLSRYDTLVAEGTIRPAARPGMTLPAWPDIRLPAGTVTDLIDSDRG